MMPMYINAVDKDFMKKDICSTDYYLWDDPEGYDKCLASVGKIQ